MATRIETSFTKLDEALINTGGIREVLITKLHKAISEYDFTIAKSTPEERDSFMSVVNSLEGILRGKEKAALDNVKLSLLDKTTTDNHNTSQAVAELLKLINPSIYQSISNPIDHESTSQKLEESFDKSGEIILDGELQTIEG
jgi:hypothetical protein